MIRIILSRFNRIISSLSSTNGALNNMNVIYHNLTHAYHFNHGLDIFKPNIIYLGILDSYSIQFS